MRALKPTAAIRAAIGMVILNLGVAAVPARAQHVPLAQLLPNLILSEITLDSPPVLPGEFPPGSVPLGFSHVAHFSPIEAHELNNPVVGIVQGFNTQMATQFSRFPLGSSSGGMTYVFDE